jgi:hypothetical protein
VKRICAYAISSLFSSNGMLLEWIDLEVQGPTLNLFKASINARGKLTYWSGPDSDYVKLDLQMS